MLSLNAFFQISWVRHRDIHLLTVGRDTYTSDQRFQAVHKPHTDEWTLQIRYPQVRQQKVELCLHISRDTILSPNKIPLVLEALRYTNVFQCVKFWTWASKGSQDIYNGSSEI